MSLKILSLNCWMGIVGEKLLSFLVQEKADVLCLQEIFSSENTSHPSTVVFPWKEDSLVVRPRLFQELQALLPDYHGFFCPTSRGPLGASEEYTNVEYGLATFVRKSVSIIEQRVAFIHKWYSPDNWGDKPGPRNTHLLRLYDHVSHQEVVVSHLHGLWIKEGKIDSPFRDAQLSRLCYRLTQFTDMQRDRVVLCGDFNVLPDSYTFKELHKFGFSELVTKFGITDTRTSLYTKPDRYADYMFVSKQVNFFSFSVLAKPEVSDHRPLIIEVK